jgi:cyclomaltodextrinase
VVAATGLDSVTQYELWKAIWSALNDGNFFELAWALGRHNTYLESFAPMTFIGNHDVTRLATRLRDDRHLATALVVLLTTGGTPSIYYGDERAFEGVKEDRTGGDDAVRPAYPGRPSDLDPSGASTHRLHRELVGLRRQRPWLHRARTDVMELSNRRILYAATRDDNRLVVALNLADDEARLPAGADMDIIAGCPGAATEDAELIVPAQGWLIATPVRG